MNFFPGNIVHYGRAELKQSDHRPVLAIIDIEGQVVVDSNRTKTYDNVCEGIGPTDCAVIISVRILNEKMCLDNN